MAFYTHLHSRYIWIHTPATRSLTLFIFWANVFSSYIFFVCHYTIEELVATYILRVIHRRSRKTIWLDVNEYKFFLYISYPVNCNKTGFLSVVVTLKNLNGHTKVITWSNGGHALRPRRDAVCKGTPAKTIVSIVYTLPEVASAIK